jgi:hypothetical protein
MTSRDQAIFDAGLLFELWTEGRATIRDDIVGRGAVSEGGLFELETRRCVSNDHPQRLLPLLILYIWRGQLGLTRREGVGKIRESLPKSLGGRWRMRVIAGYEKASKPRARFQFLPQEFRWTVTIRHHPRAVEQRYGPLVRPYHLLHHNHFRHGRESALVLT